MRRTKEDAAQTREKIFRAGIKVFAEKGYAGGTMADIARDAGVTRGAIYWHFQNKEAFFRETIARLNRSYDALINGARAVHTSVPDAIASTLAEMIRRFVHDEEFRTMQELLMRTAITQGSAFLSADRPVAASEDRAAEFLAAAMERHEIFDAWAPRTVLRAVSAFIAGTFLMILDRRIEPTETEIAELSQFVRRALAPEAAATTTALGADAAPESHGASSPDHATPPPATHRYARTSDEVRHEAIPAQGARR
jgi:AcrR family transcriptional regulator